MTALELFAKTAKEAGFELQKDEKVLNNIWLALQEQVLFAESFTSHIGELSLDEAIKASFLCQRFGCAIQSYCYYGLRKRDVKEFAVEKKEYRMFRIKQKL